MLLVLQFGPSVNKRRPGQAPRDLATGSFDPDTEQLRGTSQKGKLPLPSSQCIISTGPHAEQRKRSGHNLARSLDGKRDPNPRPAYTVSCTQTRARRIYPNKPSRLINSSLSAGPAPCFPPEHPLQGSRCYYSSSSIASVPQHHSRANFPRGRTTTRTFIPNDSPIPHFRTRFPFQVSKQIYHISIPDFHRPQLHTKIPGSILHLLLPLKPHNLT